MDAQIVAFTGLVTALIVTPGANTMLIARNVLTRGQHAGFTFILGGCLGVCLHAALSLAGLSVILVQCAYLFETIKLLGAAYLIYLGAQSLRRAIAGKPGGLLAHAESAAAPGDAVLRKAFVEGFTNILLSPETSVFYLAVLPQFITPGESVLQKSFLLASIHITIRVIWYSLLALFVGRSTAFLKRSRVHRWIEGSTGCLLVVLGLKVAAVRH